MGGSHRGKENQCQPQGKEPDEEVSARGNRVPRLRERVKGGKTQRRETPSLKGGGTRL